MTDLDVWNPQFATLHPVFQQLPAIEAWSSYQQWPECEALQRLLPADLQAQSGMPIQFVAQDATLPFPALYYEERIFQHGMVATRPANWHDFFNALMWSQYPRTKVQINAQHAADLQQYGKQRTPQRDALTLFDESGVVIVSTRREGLQPILDFDWQTLFVEQRDAWSNDMACFVIGHALLEKLLTPYVGVTAHALLVEAPPAFFAQDNQAQRAWLDQVITDFLAAGKLLSPLHLNPVPVLGIPGWWANSDAAFYQQSGYFRAKSRERPGSILDGLSA